MSAHAQFLAALACELRRRFGAAKAQEIVQSEIAAWTSDSTQRYLHVWQGCLAILEEK